MAPKSNPATEFSEYLARVLNGRKLKGITRWKKNWAGKKGETADVAGLGPADKARVLVEVERLREDPVSNVVKIWDWLEKGLVPKDVIFIHAFSGAYAGRKKPRKERAAFAGRRLRKEFKHATYEQVSFKWKPKSGAKGIGGAAKRHADRLASSIIRFIR
jgi:hypothetical protein